MSQCSLGCTKAANLARFFDRILLELIGHRRHFPASSAALLKLQQYKLRYECLLKQATSRVLLFIGRHRNTPRALSAS